MPIYIESRDLNATGGFVAEHQYLIYIPNGEELNYDAWQYIGAFPSDPDNRDGSTLTRFDGSGNVLFADAPADRWTTDEFHYQLANYNVADYVSAGFGADLETARHRELVNDGSSQSEGDLWDYLVGKANDISGEYIYKSEDLTGNSDIIDGPAVNSNSFISSILRYAQVAGHDIGAFNTDANIPGSDTWLGTTGNDVLDGRIQFANGHEAKHLYGGNGADTLYAGTNNSYLVAGKDTDRDTLIGNTGNDTLVGFLTRTIWDNPIKCLVKKGTSRRS